jgi:hypothetical protein
LAQVFDQPLRLGNTVVAERLPLNEARRAHELHEESATESKLVLVP